MLRIENWLLYCCILLIYISFLFKYPLTSIQIFGGVNVDRLPQSSSQGIHQQIDVVEIDNKSKYFINTVIMNIEKQLDEIQIAIDECKWKHAETLLESYLKAEDNQRAWNLASIIYENMCNWPKCINASKIRCLKSLENKKYEIYIKFAMKIIYCHKMGKTFLPGFQYCCSVINDIIKYGINSDDLLAEIYKFIVHFRGLDRTATGEEQRELNNLLELILIHNKKPRFNFNVPSFDPIVTKFISDNVMKNPNFVTDDIAIYYSSLVEVAQSEQNNLNSGFALESMLNILNTVIKSVFAPVIVTSDRTNVDHLDLILKIKSQSARIKFNNLPECDTVASILNTLKSLEFVDLFMTGKVFKCRRSSNESDATATRLVAELTHVMDCNAKGAAPNVDEISSRIQVAMEVFTFVVNDLMYAKKDQVCKLSAYALQLDWILPRKENHVVLPMVSEVFRVMLKICQCFINNALGFVNPVDESYVRDDFTRTICSLLGGNGGNGDLYLMLSMLNFDDDLSGALSMVRVWVRYLLTRKEYQHVEEICNALLRNRILVDKAWVVSDKAYAKLMYLVGVAHDQLWENTDNCVLQVFSKKTMILSDIILEGEDAIEAERIQSVFMKLATWKGPVDLRGTADLDSFSIQSLLTCINECNEYTDGTNSTIGSQLADLLEDMRTELYFRLSQCLLHIRAPRFTNAVTMLAKTIQVKGHYPMGHLMIGNYYVSQNNYKLGCQHYLEELSTRGMLGWEAATCGLRAMFRLIESSNQAHTAATIDNQEVKMHIDRYMATIRVLSGECAWFYFVNGHMQLSSKQYQDALTSFQKYLEVYEDDINALYSKAICYFHLGQLVPSRKALMKANALAPNDVNVLQQLAQVEHKLGLLQESYARYLEVLAKFRSFFGASKPSNSIPYKVNEVELLSLEGVARVLLTMSVSNLTINDMHSAAVNVKEAMWYIDHLYSVVKSKSIPIVNVTLDSNVSLCRESTKIIVTLRSNIYASVRNLSPCDIAMVFEEQRGIVNNCNNNVCIVDIVNANPKEVADFVAANVVIPMKNNLRGYEIIVEKLHEAQSTLDYFIKFHCTDASVPVEEDICYAQGCNYYYEYLVLNHRYGYGNGIISSRSYHECVNSTSTVLQAAKSFFQQGIQQKEVSRTQRSWSIVGFGLTLLAPRDRLRCYVTAAGLNSDCGAFGNIAQELIKQTWLPNDVCDGNTGRSDGPIELAESIIAMTIADANPISWVTWAAAKEKDMVMRHIDKVGVSASDVDKVAVYLAYMSSLEITKPADGIYGASLTLGAIRGLLQDCGESESVNNTEELFWAIDKREVKSDLESRTLSVVNRRPLVINNHIILALTNEMKGEYFTGLAELLQSFHCLDVLIPTIDECRKVAPNGAATVQDIQKLIETIATVYNRIKLKAVLKAVTLNHSNSQFDNLFSTFANLDNNLLSLGNVKANHNLSIIVEGFNKRLQVLVTSNTCFNEDFWRFVDFNVDSNATTSNQWLELNFKFCTANYSDVLSILNTRNVELASREFYHFTNILYVRMILERLVDTNNSNDLSGLCNELANFVRPYSQALCQWKLNLQSESKLLHRLLLNPYFSSMLLEVLLLLKSAHLRVYTSNEVVSSQELVELANFLLEKFDFYPKFYVLKFDIMVACEVPLKLEEKISLFSDILSCCKNVSDQKRMLSFATFTDNGYNELVVRKHASDTKIVDVSRNEGENQHEVSGTDNNPVRYLEDPPSLGVFDRYLNDPQRLVSDCEDFASKMLPCNIENLTTDQIDSLRVQLLRLLWHSTGNVTVYSNLHAFVSNLPKRLLDND